MLWKELRVSLLVGVVLSAVNFVRLILTYPGSEMVALTVALTMLCTVIVAKTIGGVLPLMAKACRMRPGHHGLAAHHHHCGRGVACDLFCRGAPAAAAVTRRQSRRPVSGSGGFFMPAGKTAVKM